MPTKQQTLTLCAMPTAGAAEPPGFAQRVISFIPGFSPVEKHFNSSETVLTVSTAKAGKPLETVSINASRLTPG
jgi:hypothetical protein